MLNPHFISANVCILYMSPYIFWDLKWQKFVMIWIHVNNWTNANEGNEGKRGGKKPGKFTIRVSNSSSRAHSVDGSNFSYSRLVWAAASGFLSISYWIASLCFYWWIWFVSAGWRWYIIFNVLVVSYIYICVAKRLLVIIDKLLKEPSELWLMFSLNNGYSYAFLCFQICYLLLGFCVFQMFIGMKYA